MDKFKEEADDLNIKISDEQLKKYIERFDQLKNSPKIEEKDLRRWPLSKLIKLVSSSEGADSEEEEEGPDVIYSENGYTVYSGGNEELCQRHRNNVPWCITRGSFGNYRYSGGKGYPSFYLISNTNLPESNKLSFVAIQVRDEDENRKYVWTPRDNSPNESSPMGWSKLTSDIPWLNEIPNIKNILKNVPLSSKEKATQVYSKSGSEISIRQWVSMPFNEKKQYLVVRKKSKIFNDITNEEFVANYLPNYPQLAAFAAVTPGVVDPMLLLKNLDKFSANDRKSITANLHNLIDIKELQKETLPFDVKKLLTILNKWNIKNDERIYVTKNGEAIVKLTFGSDINVGVFTAEDDYPSIKLNKRTAKFLLDYPKIDEIPFNNLIKLASADIIDKDFITKVLQKAEQDPNSAIIVKDTENGKILLDSNSFTSYKIEGDKISPIPFNSEEVQNILSSETENSGLIISASKTYNIILGKRKVGCIVEFEFSTDSKTVVNNLTRKITDIKPIIHQLSEKDIVDLKSTVIQALQSEPAFDISKFKITSDEHKINEGDVFFEDGGLGLANYETLLIINFMKRIEQRMMMKIEEMFDQNRQSVKGNDIEVETEKLLDIQGVSELLGLAKATIYSKLSSCLLYL
jgi:hypothetical protein